MDDSDEEDSPPRTVPITAPSPSSTSSVSSAIPPTPTRVRVTFRAEQLAKDVSQANSSLSLLLVNKALREYTQVLSDTPGHPVAFLNRSLCYLVLGFPHLAVTDAHRALVTIGATLDYRLDELDSRGHLYNLHAYALQREEQWTRPDMCFVAQGVFGFLDTRLASICVKPHRRGKLEARWSSVRGTEELLLRDASMKAYYRLAVALWKCGGGAWQSAMDQICEATSLPYCDDEDKKEFRALHNLILLEIERVMTDENRFHSYCKTKMHYDEPLVEQYRAAGIRGLLQSRFTKTPRELYPWDNHSVASETGARDLIASLNGRMAQMSTKCQYSMRPQTVSDGVPMLMLVARETVKVHEAVFSERTTLQIANLSPQSTICEICGALLEVSHALRTEAEDYAKEMTQYLSGLQLRSQVRPGMEQASDSESEDEQVSVPASPAELDASAMPQEPKAREGYQLCHGCCDVAYCSLQCKHKGSSNHAYVCKTPVPPSMYKVFAPNIWSIPSPMYTSLLDRILQRTLCTTLGDESPLSHEWVKTIHGNLGVPRQLRSDSDTSREGHACAWDESNSVSMAHLYPQWKTLMELTAGFEEHREQRKDSKHEEETPKSGGSAYKTSSDNVDGEDFERAHPHLRRTTSGLMMDWSYDTNVCQPLHLLYTIGRRHSRRSGLQLMLDVTRYDGWVLETLRAKVQAGLGVQEFPKTKIQFDDEGVRTAVHRFERSMEKDPYGPPLFGTDHDRWIASMHPLMTGLRDAKGDEEPNVRVLDRDGRLHVTALRDIEAGEVLLR